MILSPSSRLYALGAVILAALIACSRNTAGAGAPAFVVSLTIAGMAYLLAARELFRHANYPRHTIVICLALAALCRAPFIPIPAGGGDDTRRYVWDGRLQRLGYNPYRAIPADPALAGLHTDQTERLNNPDLPSPYPAGAQLFFRIVTAVRESTFAMKLSLVACDAAIAVALLLVLPQKQWVLAYAWHPLLATDVAGAAHLDVLAALLVLLAAIALERRWRAASAVAFALAVAVKLLPIVLAPLFWRRVRVRDAMLAAFVVVLLYLPFIEGGRIATGSIGPYVERFRFNDPLFASVERITDSATAASIAVFVGLVTAVWFRRTRDVSAPESWAWPMAASLACAPVIYPWYLLAFFPFLRSRATVSLMVWSVSIIPTYLVWHLARSGNPWRVPVWILAFEYGSIALIAAIVFMRSSRGSPRPA